MIGHNNKFVHSDTGNSIATQDVFTSDFSNLRQADDWGVEGAAPYNIAKDFAPILCANCYKISACCVVVVFKQPIWFSFV